MNTHSEADPHFGPKAHHTALPAAKALRIAAELSDTEEDLHAITRVVLALVGADDNLTGSAAETALASAGVPDEARALLLRALGPPPGRPTVAELRAGLKAATAALAAGEPGRTGLAGFVDELHRRRVSRTALWYLGASVTVVEAANVFVPMLGGPLGIVRMLAIAAVCGLPVALTLAWTFDVSATAQSGQASWPRLALLAGIFSASLAAAVAIWRGGAGIETPAGPPALSAANPAHIAVLGFTTDGADDDLAAFAAQLQVRLIDGLSAAATTSGPPDRRLRVLSRASVLPFMHASFAVDSLREAARIGTVLDGDVERVGGTVRVFVRLIDTRTGDQIQTSAAAVRADDSLALLDALADSVVRLIRTQLGPVVRERIRLLETSSQAAFDRVAWATRMLEDFNPTFRRGDYAAAGHLLSAADSLFADAERLDDRWIEPIVARGSLARRWTVLARSQGDSSGATQAIQRGIAHAERALALNPRDWRPLELRGELLQLQLAVARPADSAAAATVTRAAEQDLRTSLVSNPNPAGPLRMLSELAASAGRLQEALDYGRRAYDEDPFMEQAQSVVFRLYEYSFALRQDAQAARWCAEGRQRFAMWLFDDCRLALGAWSDAFVVSPDSAWALATAELDAYPQPLRSSLTPRLHGMVAAVLARAGMADSARAVLRASSRDRSAGMLRVLAGVYGILGEEDSAIAVVKELLQAMPAQREILLTTPELRGLTADPRLRQLLGTGSGRG